MYFSCVVKSTEVFARADQIFRPLAWRFLLFCSVTICVSAMPVRALDFEALCYQEQNANTRHVSNCASLITTLSTASPGDVILLADGDYNCAGTLANSGTAGNPIIVRAANLRRARFTNTTLTVNGNYNVVANLTFYNSGVNVTGNYNRVTNNKFQNNAGVLRAAVAVNRGMYNRMDHNEVVDFGTGQRGFQIVPASSGNNTAKRNVIDRNYLHRSLGAQRNGAEGIQLGTYSAHTYQTLHTIVEYNLIEQWEIDGEMISNKSSNNVIRFNTLADSNASGPIRHGSYVDVISNYFVNVRGLVNRGDDNKIIGNVVENGDLVLRNGDITQAAVGTGSSGQPASFRALVAANTVIGGVICVGCRTPGGDNSSGVPASYTDLRGNKAKVTLLDQKHTTESAIYAGTVLPALRLRSTDVGVGTPDICGGASPSGVKSLLSPSQLRVEPR